MEFKKGDEFPVNLSTTKFDLDDKYEIVGFEDKDGFTIDFTVYDKDYNILDNSSILTDLTLEDAICTDFEEEMKFWVQQFAKENNIENYSLKDFSGYYIDNDYSATLVIE